MLLKLAKKEQRLTCQKTCQKKTELNSELPIEALENKWGDGPVAALSGMVMIH